MGLLAASAAGSPLPDGELSRATSCWARAHGVERQRRSRSVTYSVPEPRAIGDAASTTVNAATAKRVESQILQRGQTHTLCDRLPQFVGGNCVSDDRARIRCDAVTSASRCPSTDQVPRCRQNDILGCETCWVQSIGGR